MTFGDRIKIIRGALSQEDFAAFLGVHRNTVISWETNKGMPKKEIITQFHETFRVDLNWLFSGVGDPFSNEKDGTGELFKHAVDSMDVAVTIIDRKGSLLYYNQHSTTLLDRKTEYIGTDIHSHHKKLSSNKKLDLMLKEFKNGRKEPFHYEAKPYGKSIVVTLSPIIKNGDFIGCVQIVRPKI